MADLKKQETLIYTVLWLLFLLLAPAGLLLGSLSGSGHHIELRQVAGIWLSFVPILAAFLIHHFLLMPLLPRRKVLYGILVTALAVLYAVLIFSTAKHPPVPEPEMGAVPPPGPLPIGPPDRPSMAPPPGGIGFAPEMTRLALMILVIGLDWGISAIFNLLRSRRRVEELENERLRLQLESLRYQINPHFFMNTLNNIQALVLTDPDKATESIGEFSKLMRILLYEGDAPVIPLSSEMALMRHFVSLMKLRYTDDLLIETAFHGDAAGAMVPPLVMTSFLENAFKHGISYSAPSYVKASVTVGDGRIVFECSNSRQHGGASGGGIGLANVRSRLDLLYGGRYDLKIDESDDHYDILMSIPSVPSEVKL